MNKHNPDYRQFLKVIRRERPDRPVLFEHGIEWPLMFEALGADALDNDNPPWGWLINTCQAFARLGYDVCPLPIHWFFHFHFVPPQKQHGESVSQNHEALIKSLSEIRDYKWPEPSTCDFSVMDKVAAATPPRREWILYAPRGIFEPTSRRSKVARSRVRQVLRQVEWGHGERFGACRASPRG